MTVGEYMDSLNGEVRMVVEKVRGTIKTEMPEAEETIGYQMLAFKVNGKYVVYCGGWKNHVGLYPIPTGTLAFRKRLEPYVAGRGTVKFPIDQPIPVGLIREMVRRSVQERRAGGS